MRAPPPAPRVAFRPWLAETLRRAEDLILPPRCLACGQLLPPRRPRSGVTPPRVDRFGECCSPVRSWPPAPCLGCLRRESPNPDPDSFEGSCPLRRQHESHRELPPLIHLGIHRDPLRAVILAAKWGHGGDGFEPLGRWLTDAIRLGLGSPPPIDALVPIPRSLRRRLRHGRPLSEELAAQVSRQVHRPILPALLRRHGPPQTRLDPEARRLAPERALIAAPRRTASLRGARVLLIDDVWTTGATSLAGAQALLAGGARSVAIAVLTVSPAQDRSSTPRSR